MSFFDIIYNFHSKEPQNEQISQFVGFSELSAFQ